MKAIINAATAVGLVLVAYNLIEKNSATGHSATTTAAAPVYVQPALDNHTYGTAWISQMVNESRNNEIAFDKHYKGWAFDAVMPFDVVQAATFEDGYSVFFKGYVECHGVTDVLSINLVGTWSKGTMARITGRIETTAFGSVVLRNCHISKAVPTQQARS